MSFLSTPADESPAPTTGEDVTHYLRCDQCKITRDGDLRYATAFLVQHRDHAGAWIVFAAEVDLAVGE